MTVPPQYRNAREEADDLSDLTQQQAARRSGQQLGAQCHGVELGFEA